MMITMSDMNKHPNKNVIIFGQPLVLNDLSIIVPMNCEMAHIRKMSNKAMDGCIGTFRMNMIMPPYISAALSKPMTMPTMFSLYGTAPTPTAAAMLRRMKRILSAVNNLSAAVRGACVKFAITAPHFLHSAERRMMTAYGNL